MGQHSGASDEDYAYGAKAEVLFEVFGLGEKLKAWEKAKIVRAPVCQCWTCKTWTCGSLCQTRKSSRGFGVVGYKESDSAKL